MKKLHKAKYIALLNLPLLILLHCTHKHKKAPDLSIRDFLWIMYAYTGFLLSSAIVGEQLNPLQATGMLIPGKYAPNRIFFQNKKRSLKFHCQATLKVPV